MQTADIVDAPSPEDAAAAIEARKLAKQERSQARRICAMCATRGPLEGPSFSVCARCRGPRPQAGPWAGSSVAAKLAHRLAQLLEAGIDFELKRPELRLQGSAPLLEEG